MSWTLEHRFTLPANPERVFTALTDARELMQWFAEHAEVEAREGGRYQFWGKRTPGGLSRADATQTITRFEPSRALGFTWTLYGVPTEVQLALSAKGEGTSLVLHQTLHGDLPFPRPRELVEDLWRLAFGNLSGYLNGGAGMLLPDFTDPRPEVRLSIEIAAPCALVFRALIEPEMVSRWFDSKNPRIEPRVGGLYDLGWTYKVGGVDVTPGAMTILELVPDERLVLSWPDWRGDASVTGQTISFQLETAGDATRLTFVHSGFGRTEDMGDFGFGWPYFLGELDKAVTTTI